MNIANQISNPSQFKDELVKFLMENKIIGTVAGVGIALASKDLIQSLVGDIVFPCIYFILMQMHGKYFTKILPDNTTFNVPNFIKHLISWALILIITYFFVTIVFKMLLGISDDNGDNKKEDKKEDKKEENVQETTREGFGGFLSCLAGRPYNKKKDKVWDFGIFKYEKKKHKKCNEGFLTLNPIILETAFEKIIHDDDNPDNEDPLHGSPVFTLEDRSLRRLKQM